MHAVDKVIDAALGSRIVGCVILVNENGKPAFARAAGFLDREAGVPMPLDAIFRYSSLTKPIVATAALRMMDAGLLKLEDPVTRYLPWFTPKLADGSEPQITLKQLLTHQSGLSYGAVPSNVSPGLSGPEISLEENLRRLAAAPLIFAPGTKWAYGMGIDVIGGVLAAIHGGSLEAAVSHHVTTPLGLRDCHFHVADKQRLAIAYADDNPPRIMRDPDTVTMRNETVTFSPSRIFNSKVPQSGGAGMAGTARDILTLLECYQPGSTFLREATRKLALANHTGTLRMGNDPGRGFGLIGSFTIDKTTAATPCSNGATDWGGVYGHSWIMDPVRRITLVICTNTALEGCLGSFPTKIRDAVFST